MGKLLWSAAAVVLASGCGEVKNNPLPDAPSTPIDGQAAPPDIFTADLDGLPPPPPVKVTVLTLDGDGAPDLAAKVIFQNPDGSVVSEATVDAMGHAQALMPLGGTVTSIRVTVDTADQLTAALTSTLGVAPGDDITLGIPAPQTPLGGGGRTKMTASFTPLPEAGTLVFSTACGVPEGSTVDPIKGFATLVFQDSCHGAKFDLLGTASGGKLAAPVFIKATDVTYTADAPFSIPGTFDPMASFAINLTHVPDVISNLTATRSSMIDGTAVAPQSSVPADPPAGALSLTVPYPPSFGTRSEVVVTMNRPELKAAQRYEMHTANLASGVDIDLDRLQLPWLTSVAITATGATWTTLDRAGTPDGMMMQWGGKWNDGTRAVTIAWRVIQPVAATGISLPKLPVADAMFDPGQQTTAVTPVVAAVTVSDYDKVNGYDELRRLPEALMTSSFGNLGAFIDMPLQRRTFSVLVNTVQPR